MKLVLKRKRSEGREGGWEERGKQSEGVRYLNTRSGQHRQSSKLPESEGRIGRGGGRTEISVFADKQTHTLTHLNTAHTHTHTHTHTHSHPDFWTFVSSLDSSLELYL